MEEDKEITKPKYIGDLIRWSYIKKYLPKKEGGLLLDMGAGQGEFKDLVESKGYKWVGIDIVPNGEVQGGDILNIPFEDNTFDTVLCVDVLEHIKEHHKAMNELYRVLKSDGLLLLHVPNKSQKHILVEPVEQDDHERRGYDPVELHTMFFDFSRYNTYATFDIVESIAWDLNYGITHKTPLNLLRLIDLQDGDWIHYGWLICGKK